VKSSGFVFFRWRIAREKNIAVTEWKVTDHEHLDVHGRILRYCDVGVEPLASAI